MEYLVLGLLVTILIVLLFTLGRGSPARGQKSQPSQHSSVGPKTKPCPLCGAGLIRGQRVKSRLITLESKSRFKSPIKESLSHVFGCPYCWPANTTYHRICPVCQETLSLADYVIGRFFEKADAKDHLHILGCTRCRSG